VNDQVFVCPFDHIVEEAVLVVVADLKKKGFNAHFIRDAHRCPGKTGFVFIAIPPVSPEPAGSEAKNTK
jgi:hypothetical protein